MAICILSGLTIPKGKHSKEHLVPKSRAGIKIIQNPANIFPATRIINELKADRLPCEFWKEKYHIAYHALESWNLKYSDKEFIEETIKNWQNGYNPDWCSICLLNCKSR